jgi:hypothetical protein
MRTDIKKYAIEFAVIFMSITLSFIVEEWRTSQQERKAVIEFLQRLKAELNEKTLQTQLYLQQNKRSSSNYERIATNFKTREIKADTLYMYIVKSEGSGFFDPELATWESLKSSGIFANVKPEIIDSVNSLLQHYKGLDGVQKYKHDLFKLTWPVMVIDIPSNEMTDQWLALKNDIPSSAKQSHAVGRTDLSKFLSNSVAVDYFFTQALTTFGIENTFKSLPEKEKRLIELIEKELEE